MKTPSFTLKDQNGDEHTLADYRGKWVVVYFYPKDDTPGCTKEACSFRDNFAVFKENNIKIFGISKDSVASHKKFKEKYHLTFTLLSDPEGEVADAFGATGMKNMFGKKYFGVKRMTFLIGPDGAIKKEYPKVSPDKHAEEILKDIDKMNSAL